MKLTLLLAGAAALLASHAAAFWSEEDQEIFRVRDQLVKSEGEGVTFYQFVGVDPRASRGELKAAYYEKSKQLHPDKLREAFSAEDAASATASENPTDSKKKIKTREEAEKRANERFALLGVVAGVLRDPQRRQRYDHFLKNGFPVWRGTGYLYKRLRPGLGSVLIGIFGVVGGGAHYLALRLGWKRRRDFAQRTVRAARRSAWGNEAGIPGIPMSPSEIVPAPRDDDGDESEQQQLQPVNRRERRQMERENRKEDRSKASGRKARKTRAPAAAVAAAAAEEEEYDNGMPQPQGAKKRVMAENGKVLIVDSMGSVFLQDEDEDGRLVHHLIDVEGDLPPRITDTMVFQLPLWAWRRTVGAVFSRK